MASVLPPGSRVFGSRTIKMGMASVDERARRETLELLLSAGGSEEPEPEGQLDLQPTTPDGEPPALKVGLTEDGGMSFSV